MWRQKFSFKCSLGEQKQYVCFGNKTFLCLHALSAPESAHLTTLMWLALASHSLIALVWRFSGLKHCLACHLQEEMDTLLLLEASQPSPPDSLAYHPRLHPRSSCASPLSPGDRSGLFNTDLTHFPNYFLSEPCEQPGTWRGWDTRTEWTD